MAGIFNIVFFTPSFKSYLNNYILESFLFLIMKISFVLGGSIFAPIKLLIIVDLPELISPIMKTLIFIL